MRNTKYTEDEIMVITENAGYIYDNFYRDKSGQIHVGFICKKHQYKGVQYVLLNRLINKKECCGVCNGRNRNTEDFKYMLKDILPDVEVIGKYAGASKRISVKCKIDGHKWEPFAYNLLAGCGCSECFNKRRGNINHIKVDEKLIKLKYIHSNIEFLEVPFLARDNVSCRCKICGCEWRASYDNLTKENHTGCPYCNQNTSFGEKNIGRYLTEWDLLYIPQYKFEDLKDISYLPFDFYLPDNNVLIEFDGEQHYYPVHFGGLSYEDAYNNFIITVKHDNMKNLYCFQHKINLIRIPYWERDNLDYCLFDGLVKFGVLVEDNIT